MTILITLLLAVAVVMAFTPKLPSAAVAFAAMALLVWSAMGWLTGSVLWFWGVAAAIVTVNQWLGQQPPVAALRYYTVGGALAGTVVGALGGQMAAVIVGGMCGAALGFVAFRRTPSGRMTATPMRQLMLLADIALPPLVTFYITVITINQLIVLHAI